MSQQLSMPTGNGLLSLNLTPPSQAPGTVGEITPGLFTGFSAMMSGVSADKGGAGVPSGVFLPPQGVELPQSLSEQAALANEQIRQRLLYLSEMLAQQQGAIEKGEGLSEEVMSELAKALRSYAEGEMPELPEEVKQKLAQIEAVTEDLVQDAATIDPVAIDASHENAEVLSEPVVASESAPVQAEDNTDEQAVDEVAGLVSDEQLEQQADPDNGASVQQPLIDSEDLIDEVQLETAAPADENPPQNNDEVAPQEVEVTAAAEPTEDLVGEEPVVPMATDVSSRSAVAEAARQDVPAEGYRNKGAYISEIARAQNRAATDTSGAAGGDEAEEAPRPLRQVAQVDVRPQEREVPRGGASGTQKEELVNTASSQSSATKPQQEPSAAQPRPMLNLDKFESMLEASQKLMSKAAAGAEKLGDSPFAQRLESAQAASAVPQSVSQPTQVQRAVAEANNLMMPQNVKLNTPAWSNALAERAIMVAAQNTRVAQIQLDPPELGSLNIRVQVNQDQVSLNFTSPHAHVRDAVEQSLPRLREMFAEQGLALQDSSVSDQQQNSSQGEEFAGQQGGQDGEGQAYLNENGNQETVTESARQLSLVDYYA
jgi:flagellar hook-length control protein FliK